MLVQRHFPKLPPRFTPPTIRVVGVLQARTSESFVGYPKFSTGFVRKEEITAIVWLDAAYCKHFCHLEKCCRNSQQKTLLILEAFSIDSEYQSVCFTESKSMTSNTIMRPFLLLLLVCSWGTYARPLLAQDEFFPGLKTLGGPLSWTDQIIDGDWRIQRHATIGHYRLLDPKDRRQAAGTLKECYAELTARRRLGQVPLMPKHVVIVLHGLSGSRKFMRPLARYLENEGGFRAITFGYASTKGTIQELTVALESVVRNLRGVEEVSFVGHSMGNLLVRHMLYRFEHCHNPPPISYRRGVMISPPNHGAELAESLGQAKLVKLALGPVVDQFAPSIGWPKLEKQLAIPAFEFGIIAGGKGNDSGYLPRLRGDDDALLSIETHALEGAADFIQVGGVHQLMPRYEESKKATLNFLKYGHFRT